MKYLIMVLICSLATSSAHAGKLKDEYVDVCESSGVSSEQKDLYCAAAKSARKGRTIDQVTGTLWAAVFAVCTVSCAASKDPTPFTKAMIAACPFASIPAAITEGIATKNFAGALMSLIPSVAMGAMSLTQKGAESTTKLGKVLEKAGPCLAALAAGVQSTVKYSNAHKNKKTAEDNLASARTLMSESTGVTSGGSTVFNTAGGNNAGPVSGSPANPGYGPSGSVAETPDPCSGSGFQAKMSCAIAGDSSLGGAMGPGFAEHFKKASGESLESFFAREHTPESALVGGMGGGMLGSAELSKLKDAVGNLQRDLPSSVTGSTYAAGSGASNSGGGDAGPDLGDMMSKLLGQGKDGAEAPGANGEIGFGAARRLASASAEDRTISIFERVTWRYSSVRKQWIDGIQTGK